MPWATEYRWAMATGLEAGGRVRCGPVIGALLEGDGGFLRAPLSARAADPQPPKSVCSGYRESRLFNDGKTNWGHGRDTPEPLAPLCEPDIPGVCKIPGNRVHAPNGTHL